MLWDGILLIHKKEQNFAICSDMDGLGGHYVKWNKSDRERQMLYDITYTWNLRIQQISEFNKERSTFTDIENKLAVTSGEGQ